jgi:hypothetical protein
MLACLAMAGCGNTTTTVLGAAASGVAAVGSAAVGAATAVGTAGVAAAGGVLGAAGGAAAGIAGTGAVTTGAVTTPEAASLAAEAAAAAAPGEGLAAGTGAGGAAGAEAVVVTAGAAGTALLIQQALGAAGAEAAPTAESLLASTRSEVDRCALQVFMGVVVAAGEADGARFALWLNQQAENSPVGDAMSGFRLVAEHIQRHLSRSAEQLRVATATLMEVEPARARQAFDTARDVHDRCPASAGRRVAELVGGDEPRST